MVALSVKSIGSERERVRVADRADSLQSNQKIMVSHKFSRDMDVPRTAVARRTTMDGRLRISEGGSPHSRPLQRQW